MNKSALCQVIYLSTDTEKNNVIYTKQQSMSILFTPLQLRHHILRNRIVVSPMCQYSSEDGFASDWHLVHLGQFAIGRAAAVIQEATAVEPEGRISYADTGIWKDEHIPNLRRIVDFVHAQDTLIGIQLAHAGRKASAGKPWESRSQLPPHHPLGWQTKAPSAIPFHETDHTPEALTLEGIQDLVTKFKEGAQRAITAGYDIIEVHAAHGYLIHQFLSPLTNLRTDSYGGSFENRIRFLIEIIQAIKTVLINQSLWVRISASDWADGGWDVEQSTELAIQLKRLGVEVIDVSSGGAVRHQQINVKENYQVPFAEEIRIEAQILTGAVGLINNAKQAEVILQNQQADLILMARRFLQNPHIVKQFAQELDEDIDWLPQYQRAKETL